MKSLQLAGSALLGKSEAFFAAVNHDRRNYGLGRGVGRDLGKGIGDGGGRCYGGVGVGVAVGVGDPSSTVDINE